DLLDFQILLEKSQILDAVLAALDLECIEGIALVETEFTADDLVAGHRIALNVDPLDIDARRFTYLEGDAHRLRFGVALEIGRNVCEGVTASAGYFVKGSDGVLDSFRVEPVARFDLQQRLYIFGV